MQTWIASQQVKVYWLATASVYKEALKQIASIDYSVPLFFGETFKESMVLSPWLAPVTSLNEVDNQTLKQGLFLCSDRPVFDILSHLRSLLIAGLDGVEVLFRFYDRSVFSPMLHRLSDKERSALMGMIETWAYWEEDRVTAYTNVSHEQFTTHTEPWWVITLEHLQGSYNTEIHANIIERRCWKIIPEVMRSLFDTPQHIQTSLEYANLNSWNKERAELYSIAKLISDTDFEIESIALNLQLTDSEKTILFKCSEDVS